MFRLLRYFSMASAVALIAVTFALVYLYRDNAMEGLVVSAEGQNITLARSFANNLWPRFSHYVMTVPETDGDKLRARPETAAIDEAVRTLTAGLPVLKVKIYNLDGRTIYSSQPSQIGADKSHNPGFLKSARAEKPASKFSFRENFSAFSGEVLNRGLVESYLPIWGDDDAIEGVFELYTDVTPLVARIDRSTDRLTVGLLITFALLYGILFVIVRCADQILKRQYSDQLEYREQVEVKNTSLEREIDERKRTEEALERLTRQNELILNSAGEGIYGLDLAGHTTFINPAAAKMIGWELEELIGKAQHAILHHTKPDGSPYPREECPIYAAFRDGSVHHVDDEVFWRKDGTSFPVEYVSTPIRDENGEPTGAVVIFRDITARKKAEEALRESEARFRAVIDNSPTKIHIKDAEGRYTLVNPLAEKLFGFTDEEARGKTSYDIFPKEVADAFTAHDRQVVESGEMAEQVEHFTLEDGEHTYLTVKFPIPDGQGGVAGIAAIGTDITERKQAEEALAEKSALLETTFENMSQGIVVYDADFRLTAFNQHYADLYRYPPGFLRLGMPFEDIARFKAKRGDYGPGDAEELARSRVLRKKRGEQVREQRTIGNGRIYTLVWDPIPGGGSVTTHTDVTAQETAKTEMLQSKELAELANRTKSEFLANMSHELRTPLNAILGFSELMGYATLGPLGNPKYEEYTKDINDSGRHLLGLIDDILDLSKIEAGKLELDEEDIDVAKTTGSCMVLVKERARNGGVELKTDIPDGLPALHADKRKLKQILVNLLSNAVKFTQPGGEVTLKAWSREDSGYVFQIIDTGIGIALADIPTALSPFGQVDSALSRKFAGTGLGLPLTKSLVELHGGYLDLQSEEGAGTTVTVRFPKERIVHLPEVAATGSPAV